MSDSTQASNETSTQDTTQQPTTQAAPVVTASVTQVQTPAPVQQPATVAATQPSVSVAAQQPAAQQAPTVAAPAKVDMTSDQLKARLNEERTKAASKAREEMLAELGEPLEQVKARIAEAKRLEEEKLSELQRRDKHIEELRPKAERAGTLESVVRRQADAALSVLTDDQRAAVTRLAGDDPVRVFDTIEALRPTWVQVAHVTTAPPVAAPATTQPASTSQQAPQAQQPANAQAPAVAPPVLPPPATTTSSSAAPTTTVPQEPDIYARYQQLRGDNPIAASAYRRAHWAVIRDAEQRAQAS